MNHSLSILKSFGKFKSIICLNGDLPNKQLIDIVQLEFALPIIAVDGASRRLSQIQIEPQVIIGDLDSDDPTLFSHIKRILKDHQDYSDFYKTTMYLKEQNLLPAIIFGIDGGYLDHVLHNISIFSQMYSIYMTNTQIGLMVTNTVALTLPINSKISIIGTPQAIVNSNGLKWELVQHKLNMFGSHFKIESSLSNRTLKENIKIDVISGRALIIINTLNSTD